MSADLALYALGLGDDALIAAQRLGELYASSPEMEEDVALANIALDQLGAARLLLGYAAELTGAGDEDTLAFLRGPAEFRNHVLVELPNGDFAVTVAKLLFLAAWQRPLYARLAASGDERLAGIAATAGLETAYHLDHATQWTVRLGDGTPESHRRMQDAIDRLWPYTRELFVADPVARRLPGIAADPDRAEWTGTVEAALAEATLRVPGEAGVPAGLDGRAGRHTEHLTELLDEMQRLHRAHPGARW
ncbi:1,2-phenylacetyl-CoA epoxidase subunit PaaC [Catenuloplanes atrovinosus]|uniref:Ring-1,2-phenylacetyl-CoA epoxidase subunit PaaC n=1 Tax=Catenuloplanes atrovinosus TaxID=137266 RepID=A0AAE4CCX5_9ACTN|nr:1,2-phenylacetyl-CoA epoxidase subunit PaaC [Catenuloplanes atrovinosus]MDR7279717.1 ring-1,2-phenylacetyl-CoA epoxidase subunit PaaC [Catenuloplanes atrovinosus]